MRLTLGIAALAATFVAASPAAAQTVVGDGYARGTVIQPVTLAWASDLDFGTVIPGPTDGTVRVAATATGSRSTTGGVTGITTHSSTAGSFLGAGDEGTEVQLSLEAPTSLTSGLNVIDVNEMFLDEGGLTKTVTIDSTGSFTVYIGGDFEIKADQPSGTYSGIYHLTAAYQ